MQWAISVTSAVSITEFKNVEQLHTLAGRYAEGVNGIMICNSNRLEASPTLKASIYICCSCGSP